MALNRVYSYVKEKYPSKPWEGYLKYKTKDVDKNKK